MTAADILLDKAYAELIAAHRAKSRECRDVRQRNIHSEAIRVLSEDRREFGELAAVWGVQRGSNAA